MKFRIGFVSNSSTSTFVIKVKDITEEQLSKILNVKEEQLHGLNEDDVLGYGGTLWEVKVQDESVSGYEYMGGGFDISHFFDTIGVNRDVVVWKRYGCQVKN